MVALPTGATSRSSGSDGVWPDPGPLRLGLVDAGPNMNRRTLIRDALILSPITGLSEMSAPHQEQCSALRKQTQANTFVSLAGFGRRGAGRHLLEAASPDAKATSASVKRDRWVVRDRYRSIFPPNRSRGRH